MRDRQIFDVQILHLYASSMATITGMHQLTADHFAEDRHAANYLGVLTSTPGVLERLLAILNDPGSERLMEHESSHQRPALRGVRDQIEGDPLLASAAQEPRFRQAIGVAIRLKMELLGWTTTGLKGPVGGTTFTRAERYVRADPHGDPIYAQRALAALDRVATMGSKEEQRESWELLDSALRSTRAEQGRPY